jgi:hypothetical protein
MLLRHILHAYIGLIIFVVAFVCACFNTADVKAFLWEAFIRYQRDLPKTFQYELEEQERLRIEKATREYEKAKRDAEFIKLLGAVHRARRDVELYERLVTSKSRQRKAYEELSDFCLDKNIVIRGDV